MITEQTRINALAAYLYVESNEVTQALYGDGFESYGEEYLVLTDEEADAKCAEYIKESVWAFNSDFLAAHSSLDADIIRMIQEAKCEDANEPLRRTIEDMDYLIEDAIRADGRGHFIAPYDFEENEKQVVDVNGKSVTLYIYRTN